MAVIQLAQALTFTPAVSPVCLPDPGVTHDDVAALVTGWGTLASGGDQPRVLQEVMVDTMSNVACTAAPSRYNVTMISPRMICAAR